MVRAFLAIDLPWKLKKKIYELSLLPIPDSLKVKWVEEKNLHLTLKFFGNISENLLEELYKETFNSFQNFISFELVINDLGYFSEKASPRVVWIGIKDEEKKLAEVYENLKKIFKKYKIKDTSEKFHPHITLFRIKKLGSKEDFEKYFNKLSSRANFLLKNLKFSVSDLTFYKSTLYSSGPVYEVLYKVYFKN